MGPAYATPMGLLHTLLNDRPISTTRYILLNHSLHSSKKKLNLIVQTHKGTAVRHKR